MSIGQPHVGTSRDLGPACGVLMRSYLVPGKRDLHSRELGLILVLDRKSVIDVLGVCLAHVHGQRCSPFMRYPPACHALAPA